MEYNDRLRELIEDPKVHYIYQIDDSIFGSEVEFSHFIIVAEQMDDLHKADYPFSASFYTTEQWFQKILNGELLGWITACINKKYICKETVKLIMKFDDIILRKEADYLYKNSEKTYWSVGNLKLILQILINHKIVNYNIYPRLRNMDLNNLELEATRVYQEICNLTDVRYKEHLKNKQLKRLKKKDE